MILIDTHFHIEKDSDLEKIVNDDGLYALNEYLQSFMPF